MHGSLLRIRVAKKSSGSFLTATSRISTAVSNSKEGCLQRRMLHQGLVS